MTTVVAYGPHPDQFLELAAALAGEHVEVRLVPGDHGVPIDPAGPAWRLVREWLRTRRTAPDAGATLEP